MWNGRWWLVDPDGHIFFSLGCNYVRLQGRTPVVRRERFFSWLPARDDALFADCWKDGKDFMTGVLTVTDTPHPEMVEATRELARELYPQPARR